jgi:hypothetical protein
MVLSKKIFFISSVLLLITLLLWGAYFFSFRSPTEQIAQVAENLKEKTDSALNKPTASDVSTIAAISEDPVLSPVYMTEDRVIRYYSKSDKQAYQIDPEGKNKKIFSRQDFPGLVSAAWSPDGSRALLMTEEATGKNRFYFYNYESEDKVLLKDNASSVVWMDNDKICYNYYDQASRKNSLNIAAPDGSNWKKVIDIDQKNIIVSPVPKTGLISFWNTPDALTETSLQLVSQLGTEGRTIFSGKFGAAYLWNGDGTRALVSHSDMKSGSKIRLAIINSRGEDYQDLGIPTLVSKAVWSRDNKTVYYALPVSLRENDVMPNDYASGKFNTADTFWKVDVTTGKKSRVVELDKITSNFDAINLFFNYDESVLYFVNRVDNKLYRISL